MSARLALILLASVASAASAAPTLDPQFGNHAVVQRDRPVILSGDAAPGERVTVSFNGEQRSAAAGRNGRWRAEFTARPVGGPHSITVTARSGSANADDVMVGDVWLCSGQSNMEFPLRRANNGDAEAQAADDPQLRLMKVPQQVAPSPSSRFAKSPSWKLATPDSAKDFSAACYFLVRDLRRTEKAPVGAIDDTWGGTPIRAWMNESSVRASGSGAAADVVDLYRKDPTAAVRRFGEEWGACWRSKTGDQAGQEPWVASDRLSWKVVPSLQYWDAWGPEWKGWIGSIWLRQRVALTAAEAAQPATLGLSVIDDIDHAFVNGVSVGGRNDPVSPREYPVTRGLLKPGVNEILVLARNNWGPGGAAGPADKFFLKFADGHTKSLATGWEYSRIVDTVTEPPVAPWDGPTGVSTIYNAMISPLGPIGLKGVAWYQGEADVGQSGYDRRLAAWAANWRSQFRDSQLPFLIVGLAGWQNAASHPIESGWAALINEQRLATQRDPRMALASAIDLGELNDLHPPNKQDVGRRLALAAHAIVYRDGGGIGPLPTSAAREGNAVVVTFTKPLQVLSGANANAFELCGPSAGSCRYADAQVRGNSVAIAADGQPVTRVRHAWADFPVINLYDLDLLPAPVFEIEVQ
jgi:sialate O-acetylesterase